MRTSGVLTSARWLLPAAALSLLGCPKQELAPLGPCTVSAVTERVDQTGVDQVDLLFVIDNSGSMASEQTQLGLLLPKLVTVLTTGDRKPDLDDEPRENNDRYFTPVRSLHIGVVTTNMGGSEDPQGEGVAINSCAGVGDDGRLQNSTAIAQEGVIASTTLRQEFEGYAQGEEVFPPDPTCKLSNIPKYQQFTAGSNPADNEKMSTAVANQFRCISRVGVRGCPFEQQLEAMWKALAPAEPPDDVKSAEDKERYKFLDGKGGQGTRFNDGFLRPEAILAVMHVTDEEDCSIKPEGRGLFDNRQGGEAEEKYGKEINLRCGKYGESMDLVWDTDRYVKGLKSLKPDYPDRIIFGGIIGIPAVGLKEDITIDEILARPDMQFRTDPSNPALPAPSCIRQNPMDASKSDKAYPPRRHLQVAKEFGDNAIIHSICAEDYAPALDLLIERIAKQLKGNCLPRQLRPNAAGLVECRVYELLPASDPTCKDERGHTGSVVERTIRENGKNVKRKACLMSQVAVLGGKPATKAGWYYDDFSDDLKDCATGEQQRIAFSFGELPSGSGATFECFQPVAKVDVNAKGFDAVNTRCTDGVSTEELCEARSDDEYQMTCIHGTETCQIKCANDPDCPPGWICESGIGLEDKTKFCQQPTCQAGGGGATE